MQLTNRKKRSLSGFRFVFPSLTPITMYMTGPLRHMHNIFRYIRTLCFLLAWGGSLSAIAQIEFAGTPRGRERGGLRSVMTLPTLRLPYFDADSARYAMEAQSGGELYFFAHKFDVQADIIRDGEQLQTGGMDVWLYRVRSSGAKSLNFFFDQFYLPEGGLLYIYSTRGENIIGGFGAVNNNPSQVLATRPISSDDVIIECQVPQGAEKPRLHLSEVNHGVREMRAAGPSFSPGVQKSLVCAPHVICFPEVSEVSRAVCVVSVNGVATGTGCLVNTVKEDGVYMMTASHVYTLNFRYDGVWRDREHMAETMVLFFNYKSPLCSGDVAPQVDQTIAGASLIGLDMEDDITLVKLHQNLPESYGGYCLGWDMSQAPQAPLYNLHHPNLEPMRLNICYKDPENSSFTESGTPFKPNRHWKVNGWDMGTTERGSSGSPLLDRNLRMIGGLTAGASTCYAPGNADYFFRLNTLLTSQTEDARQILEVLNPGGELRQRDGKHLSKPEERWFRISHIKGLDSGGGLQDKFLDVPSVHELLGGKDLEAIGERYFLRKGAQVGGFYVVFRNDKEAKISGRKIHYALYGNSSGVPLAQGEISLGENVTIPGGNGPGIVRNVRPSAEVYEIYTELAKPITMHLDGPLILSLRTMDLGQDISLMVQRDGGYSGMVSMRGGKWLKDDALGDISLWIDPLVSDPNEGLSEGDIPLMLVKAISEDSISLLLHPKEQDQPTQILVYNLLGGIIMKLDTHSTIVQIPRERLAGLGVVLIQARNGDDHMAEKIYVPTR